MARRPRLLLAFAFSVLLSAMTYLVATNQALNFLEQREAVNLTLQVAVAVGALLSLLAAADAVSGERERGTLESLLLAPSSRRGLVAGKRSRRSRCGWRAFASRVPYVWFLGRGVGAVGDAVGGAPGRDAPRARPRRLRHPVSSARRRTASASRCACSSCSRCSCRRSFRSGASTGWAGELLRVNPLTAGRHYMRKS